MKKILVVDSNLVNRQYVLSLLNHNEQKLFEASDSREGLEIIQNETPDVVIADILTQAMDSYAISRRLREDASLVNIKGIFYAASDREHNRLLQTLFHSDIAQYKRVEEALRESESRYRNFIANSAEAIWRCELEKPLDVGLSEDKQIDHLYNYGYIAECNDVLANQYGFGWGEEMIGLRFTDFLNPQQIQKIPYLKSFIKSHYCLIDAESEEKDRLGNLKSFIKNLNGDIENGFLLRIWGIQRDITERKKVEQSLKENEARLRKQNTVLMELAKHPLRNNPDNPFQSIREITEVIADTLEVERVSVWLYNSDNSAIRSVDLYERSLNRHSEGVELARKDYPLYFKALEVESYIAANDACTDPRTKEFTESYLNQLGIKSMLDAPLHVNGKLIGVICHEHIGQSRKWALDEMNFANAIADSISLLLETHERQKAEAALMQIEEQLRQAQKMEAIGRLAGGVAHDFNNLLTAINGYSDLTLLKLEKDSPFQHNIREIRRAGERAISLTRQLLAFSRKQILHTKVLNPNEIVKDMERILVRLIGEDIKLITRLDTSSGNVKADMGQVEQIIMNLVINARDAMPDGGKLIIETSKVYLDELYASSHINVIPGNYVMIAVTDTGCGIDAETREKIFEPFFTTKDPDRGTGLGLSTVYGIVKQSGGSIWVYSEKGQGTTFKIFLPSVDETTEPETQVEREKPVSSNKSATILLVEDEIQVQDVIKEILKLRGHEVLIASDGISALSVVENCNEPIDLLITDIVMPQMGGHELVKQIRELHPNMKVLYMSGYTEMYIVQENKLVEGAAFIQKPFTEQSFNEKVEEVLSPK